MKSLKFDLSREQKIIFLIFFLFAVLLFIGLSYSYQDKQEQVYNKSLRDVERFVEISKVESYDFYKNNRTENFAKVFEVKAKKNGFNVTTVFVETDRGRVVLNAVKTVDSTVFVKPDTDEVAENVSVFVDSRVVSLNW